MPTVLTVDVTDYPYFADCVDGTDCTDFADCIDCVLTIVLNSDCSDSHCMFTVLMSMLFVLLCQLQLYCFDWADGNNCVDSNCADCIVSAHCIH